MPLTRHIPASDAASAARLEASHPVIVSQHTSTSLAGADRGRFLLQYSPEEIELMCRQDRKPLRLFTKHANLRLAESMLAG